MTQYRKVLLFLIFSVMQVLGAEASSVEDTYVCEQLKKIPAKDRETLTLFFETLLSNNFAYTLFGDKPVSCDTYPVKGDRSRKCSCLNYGKTIWDRYSSLFPSSKFIFKYEHRDILDDIFLINKAAFLQTVEQHLPLFQSILGSAVTPENLLNRLLQENTTYEEVLNYHSGLIGLLYGFGYTNSFLYNNLHELDLEVQKWLEPPVYFFKEDLSLELYKDPAFYFQNLAENPDPKIAKQVPAELKALFDERSRLDTLEDAYPEEDSLSLANLSLFPLPAFGADRSNRTDANALFEKYTKTRHDIVRAYHQRDFLEVTLCKLVEK